ncbi:unnamed protein product [Paramecium primaurelia]|uniref:RNA polymerase subunit H/Rpb5 C-terminal domain-containing protein n=1 Tax=Paramecium primaurelia TaxID=5886 RepID=A0A8S1NEG1_PARPR|nr:unnamed protein product [Paramecium primaurelia]
MIEEEYRPEDKASIKKKYKVFQTLASMIRQRGYFESTPVILVEDESFELFEAKYRTQTLPQSIVCFKREDETDKLLIIFYTKQAALSFEEAKKYVQDFTNRQVKSIIMVFPTDPFATKPQIVDKKARLFIDQVNSTQTYSFELFGEDDLVYDVTKHELVPQHIILNDNEKELLLKKYGLVDNQLPRILQSDPIARFLGLHHGDVVKIIRKSETAGLYVTYRIAI